MRLLLAFTLVLGFAAMASAQTTPLDWTDGGSIVMPTADLDGDAFPAGTTIRCVVDLQNPIGTTIRQVIVNSTVGAAVPITKSQVKGSQSTAEAFGNCTTPLSAEIGNTATATVSLPRWRGPARPTLQP